MNTKQTQSQDLISFLEYISKNFSDREALAGRTTSVSGSTEYSYTYVEIYQNSQKIAQKLLGLGLQKNDRVLLYAKSCPEFSIGFFAIPLAGGVVVPLDVRLTVADQKYIAEFSEAKFIICMDSDSAFACEKLIEQVEQPLQLVHINNSLKEDSSLQNSFDLSRSLQKSSELTVLTFTSGTTSKPKGVMLSWDNLYYQLETLLPLFQEKSNFRMLSVLPLHHMFEITAGFLLPLFQGGYVYYANSMIPHQIISLMSQKKIRDVLAVPLFLSAIKKGIASEIQQSKAKSIWFNTTYFIARYIPIKSIRRLLFAPLHKKFGGELRRFISGASALDTRVALFFETIGISIYEGFGMTETSPVVSCSSQNVHRLGSIGKAISGTNIKLHPETQELLVQGPGVMLGYYKNPEATAACLSTDGWLNTGDVAEIDQDGYLYIRGRNKDIIVLGSGKKVAPEEIENHFRDITDLQDICAVGIKSTEGATRGTEVITLVVVPTPTCSLTEVELNEILRKKGTELSYYKRPSQFVILREGLPKTSTMKIKKNLVKEIILQKRTTI